MCNSNLDAHDIAEAMHLDVADGKIGPTHASFDEFKAFAEKADCDYADAPPDAKTCSDAKSQGVAQCAADDDDKSAEQEGATDAPTDAPTDEPSSDEPTIDPAGTPTDDLTETPTDAPATEEPTDAPATETPTDAPTEEPTDAPTEPPSGGGRRPPSGGRPPRPKPKPKPKRSQSKSKGPKLATKAKAPSTLLPTYEGFDARA